MNARKTAIGRRDALLLAKTADEIYVAKGKKTIHIDMKNDPPDDDTLARLLLGNTGNMRAPSIRKGRALIVGFDEAVYKKLALR